MPDNIRSEFVASLALMEKEPNWMKPSICKRPPLKASPSLFERLLTWLGRKS